MQLIKANLDYKPQGWVTTCRTCGCPYCGAWIKANVEPVKYDPLTKK